MTRTILLLFPMLFLTACGGQVLQTTGGQAESEYSPAVVLSASDQRIIDQLMADMVPIPAGEFLMGDRQGDGEDDELPVHTVRVAAFALARYELTFEQYDVFVRATDGELPEPRWGAGRQPVIDVTWQDAADFTDWLSRLSGLKIRLPTEAEWEYAARAGSESRYSFGDDRAELCQFANVADQSTDIGWRNEQCNDGYEAAAPVGSFKPNAFGLYDMHGNVWEWTGDCWYRNYRRARADSLPWSKSDNCSARTQRGGSWFYGAAEARSAYRTQGNDLDKSVNLGFRIAQDIEG